MAKNISERLLALDGDLYRLVNDRENKLEKEVAELKDQLSKVPSELPEIIIGKFEYVAINDNTKLYPIKGVKPNIYFYKEKFAIETPDNIKTIFNKLKADHREEVDKLEAENGGLMVENEKLQNKVKKLNSELNKWQKPSEGLSDLKEQANGSSKAGLQAYINGLEHKVKHLESEINRLADYFLQENDAQIKEGSAVNNAIRRLKELEHHLKLWEDTEPGAENYRNKLEEENEILKKKNNKLEEDLWSINHYE